MIDPYSTLGVSKTATDAEIKSAYRRLAKQWHPDAGGDETKFADVNNAYNMIKDAEHRQNFENQQFGPSNFQQSQSPFGHHFGNFENIFSQMFGQNMQRHQTKPTASVTYHVSIEDVYNCAVKTLNISIPNGSNKPVNIRIPRGIKSGEEVNYQGMSPTGGDLVVKYILKETKEMYAVEHNIVKIMHVTLKEAMFGAEKIVQTLDKRQIKLHIKSGTQSGTKLRIPEGGLPRRNLPNGDFIFEVQVKIPKLNNNDLDKTLDQVL
tara:strand:- start:2386 stop:3177 length:792 start_codon:yes stop_codon:yes gene_type:complete